MMLRIFILALLVPLIFGGVQFNVHGMQGMDSAKSEVLSTESNHFASSDTDKNPQQVGETNKEKWCEKYPCSESCPSKVSCEKGS